MLSYPQPLSEPRERQLPLFPQPPQKNNKMMIQMIELQQPLLELFDVPHPHPVAVKSLICCLQKFLFMLYHMRLEKVCD